MAFAKRAARGAGAFCRPGALAASRSSRGRSRADGPAVPAQPLLRGPFQERKRAMRILGYATAISLALGGVALAALAVQALPDLRRYLKMRSI